MKPIEQEIQENADAVRAAYQKLIASAPETAAPADAEATRWSTFLSKPTSITPVNPQGS